MKLNKIAIALLLGCAAVSTVYGNTTYYIAGSTAYRKATFVAMNALFTTAPNTLDANYPIGDTSSTPTGSGATVNNDNVAGSGNVIWSGNLTSQGLGHVVIVANWSGSVSGQKANAEGAVWPTFLDPATVAPAENFIGHVPDLNVSDNFQKTTTYFPPLDPSAVTLKRTAVAIITFIVAKDPNAPATLSNWNSELGRGMYNVGFMNLAQWTGNSADNNKYVIPTGRDDDSGTRTVWEADNGIAFTSTLLQWGLHTPSVDGVAGYTPYQFGLPSVNAADGNGYASGGTVAKVLIAAGGPGTIVDPVYGSGTNNTAYFVGYVGVNDATGTIPTTQWLNYNGVPYSIGAVQEGNYTYWGYENLDVRTPRYIAADLKPIYDALSALMIGQAGTLAGTLAPSSMNCSRTADGQTPSHN